MSTLFDRLKLLFDEGQSLKERVIAEQFSG